MATKLLSLLAISSLAITGPTTVTALSIGGSHHISRHSSGHEILAKDERDTSIGKVGLAWNDPQANDLLNFESPTANTVYTWSCVAPSTAAAAGMEFVPMLWGPTQLAQCEQQLPNLPPTVLLGPNEPDDPSQSNLSPQAAAQFWMNNIQKWKQKGFRLGSPAPTGTDRGFQWMKSFLLACQGCTIDFLAFHYYGTSAQQMNDFLSKVHNTFGMNIWVTEFACEDFNGGTQPTTDQAFNFMGDVKSFMDNAPWIERYFAFGALPGIINFNPAIALMDNNGQPTALGHLYLGN